ncbi:hypothetical protein [Acinetobacter sp. AM]|uniref:hypothetical protein n=1 Tax=Acinetobacter sp. AM TaxID=2170730 RepID=UPI00105831FC|nr:hypothetical protein [Acinetobacter sp. AM]
MLKILVSTLAIIFCTTTYANKAIPMSEQYYQGKYFLISNKKSGNINTVIYKAIFKAETIYSKMEINCSILKIRATGEGINSINNLKEFSNKGNWSDPVYKSTRYDVMRFVCKK